jgi:hypothetical protein
MKMRDVIDMVSEVYRDERGKVADLQDELRVINRDIDNAEKENWANVTIAEYKRMLNKQASLREEIQNKTNYYDGISFVREMLMDLGFDVEIEN